MMNNHKVKNFCFFSLTVFLMISVSYGGVSNDASTNRLHSLDQTIDALTLFQKTPFEKDASKVLDDENLRGKPYINCDQWPVECKEEQRKIKTIDNIVTNLIGDLYDEDYDSNDLKNIPMLSVWPPKGAVKGIQYGAVDPNSIEDKVLREKYLSMIEANNRKGVNNQIQGSLKRLLAYRNPENYTPQKIRMNALDKTLNALIAFQKEPLKNRAWVILNRQKLQTTAQINCIESPIACEQELSKIKAIDKVVSQLVHDLYDKDYDPKLWKNQAITQVWPPEDPVNQFLAKGVDPNKIADEALREKYIVIMQKNENRYNNRWIQERLRELMVPGH